MKGTWTGTGEAIVDGATTHHPAEAASRPAGKYRLREETFTWRIEGQDGRRFWGTTSSDQKAGLRLMGSLSMDGKRLYMAGGKDGYIDAVMIDADTINACHRNVDPGSATVGCSVLKRQK